MNKEIEKALLFNNSHNIQLQKYKGLMAVSEARKLINQAVKEERERVLNKLKDKLKNCDEFFNVEGYDDIMMTDKFMSIVEIFTKELLENKE